MQEEKRSFVGIGIWLIGMIFLYLGIKVFPWGLAVGTFLILSFIIYIQIHEVRIYYQKLKTNIFNSKPEKIYFYISILQSILVVTVCLTVLTLILYSTIYSKNRETILNEFLDRNYIGYVFTFFGCWGLITTIKHIWNVFLLKDSNIAVYNSSKIIIFGFFGIVFFAVGILLLSM